MSSFCTHLIFYNRVAHRTCSSLLQLEWLASEFQGSSCFHLPNTRMTNVCRRSWLMRMLRTAFRSSCLLSRHLADGASVLVSLLYKQIYRWSSWCTVSPAVDQIPQRPERGRKQLTLGPNLFSPGSQSHCSARGGMWVVKAGKITQV